jgi:DNA-binding transcriptional regulator YhcF (GntR family)
MRKEVIGMTTTKTNGNENTNPITEEQLIENKSFRDKCVERIDVLDKIKKLFLIPGTELMTMRMIAKYFEVDVDTIKKCYQRHKDEIDEDGVSHKKHGEIKSLLKGQSVPIEEESRMTTYVFPEIKFKLQVPNVGITVFSKRAVLRIGILLRDNPISKEIRTQLLNVFDGTDDKQKVIHLDEEKQLLLKVGEACVTRDIDTYVFAMQNYVDYLNRHNITLQEANKQLKADNKLLAKDTLTWGNRESLNSAIRSLAVKTGTDFPATWKMLYKELRYKHHISLKNRGKAPYIQHIKENEWSKVVKSFCALCESLDVSPSEILNEMMFNGKGKVDVKSKDSGGR